MRMPAGSLFQRWFLVIDFDDQADLNNPNHFKESSH
jgi:hypothetical protein